MIILNIISYSNFIINIKSNYMLIKISFANLIFTDNAKTKVSQQIVLGRSISERYILLIWKIRIWNKSFHLHLNADQCLSLVTSLLFLTPKKAPLLVILMPSEPNIYLPFFFTTWFELICLKVIFIGAIRFLFFMSILINISVKNKKNKMV